MVEGHEVGVNVEGQTGILGKGGVGEGVVGVVGGVVVRCCA